MGTFSGFHAIGVAGLLLFFSASCHSDSLGGSGGSTGAGTGGSLGRGGTGGVGGTGGLATRGTGGLLASGGLNGSGGFIPGFGGGPAEWGDGSVVPGTDCMQDPSVCGPNEFCGIGEINGYYVEHYCFSKGNCETCECLMDTLSGFYNQTHTTSTFGVCWCNTPDGSATYGFKTTPDAAAGSVIVVSCDG